MHDAALALRRHPIFDEGLEDVALVVTEGAATQICAVVLHVTPFVSLIEIGGKGHIQLHGGGFRRQDGEAVLTDDQGQGSAVVPLHMELPDIVDEVQRSHGAGWYRRIGIFHLSELDSAACGILLPQKIQPFSRYGVHHVMPPIIMP